MTQSGFINGVLSSPVAQIGAHRLGIRYSAGTFTVCCSDNSDLSVWNPAYITLQSQTSGLLKTFSVTANQDFIDDAGASEIIGNLFGLTTGVAVTVDVPFYLYACTNDAEDHVTFGISRIPNLVVAPAVGSLGSPASATANDEYSIFLFEDVTLGDYDSNPVICLGSFRMRMSNLDDWTVQALNSGDGVGNFNEQTIFEGMPGQFGANSGTFTLPNGGTCATFPTQNQYYMIDRRGKCFVALDVSGLSVAGAGNVDAQFAIPFRAEDLDSLYGGQVSVPSLFFIGGPSLQMSVASFAALSNYCVLKILGAIGKTNYYWVDFTGGNSAVVINGYYQVANHA